MKKLIRVLFSRYAISALIILIELVLMAQLILSSWAYSYLALGVAILVSLITVIFIINRDANPEYKVSWIIVVLILPAFGTLLYILFYRRRMTKGRSVTSRDSLTRLTGIGLVRAALICFAVARLLPLVRRVLL